MLKGAKKILAYVFPQWPKNSYDMQFVQYDINNKNISSNNIFKYIGGAKASPLPHASATRSNQ